MPTPQTHGGVAVVPIEAKRAIMPWFERALTGKVQSMRFETILLSAVICSWLTGSACGQGFFAELFQPWPDEHASPLDTPYEHPFFAEPAYLDRELLISYSTAGGVDNQVDELELEFELEWALTKRLGIVFAAPIVAVNPDVGPFESGFGDLAIGGRALLVDRPRWLLSALVEMEVPTGDANRGLGAGEALIFPSLLWWVDLGSWRTLQGQVGPEVGLDSGDAEMVYFLALTKTWQGPVLVEHACRCCERHGHGEPQVGEHGHDEDDHSHHAPGLITLYLEATGVTALNALDPVTHFEVVPGLSYTLTEALELRAAARFPLFRPERLDQQLIISIIRHF